MDLSPSGRARGLPSSLSAELLVVGGGITGLGVALDAASRGIDVLLVEKGDFAGGTSSRTTKLIHGGLRYLRQGRVGLVRQAARERGRLSRLAPHLVQEMPFLLPARGPLHRLSLSMGTRLYDLLGGFHGTSREAVSARRLREWIPEIADRFHQGGVVYHDAWADDCRLCLHVLRKAVDLGARAINYAELVAPLREGGRIAGARVRDRLDGREIEIRARKVVAAVGAWTNELLERLGELDAPVVRPTKGAHIVVPRGRVPLPVAAAMPSRIDGRLLFAIPHGADHVLVGTTDTDYDGPLDAPRASAGDVAYLQERVLEALGVRLGAEDVRSSFAGVRPLLLGGPAAPSSVSREHAILERPSGLLLVAGGKLTTFRVMAEEAVDRLYPATRSTTAEMPLYACAPPAEAPKGMSTAVLLHLVRGYGSRWERVAATGRLAPLVDGLPYVEGEVDVAVQEEGALTVADVLSRRTRAVLYAEDQGRAAARRVASRMRELLGWSAGEEARQIDAYDREIELHRPG